MGRRTRSHEERPGTFLGQMRRALRKYGTAGRMDSPARPKRGHIAVRPPHAQSRRCVIKARYVPLRASGVRAARLHLAYLERDGVDRDGAPGRLYGPDDAFTADAFREPLAGEKRQFRFIVSPEDGDRLDLSEFTRQFMAQVEKVTGRRLIWGAVNHHNTDNPHVHIVVRGVDRDGDDLRIDGPYIARGMRWRAQEIVTRELGRRSEMDLMRERSVDVGRERLTEIDRVIDAHAAGDGTVTLGKLLASPGGEGRVCIGRLQTLEILGLARQPEIGLWQLTDGWKESLAALGERQDVIERLWPFLKERAVSYRIVDPQKPIASFEGKVVGKGLDDELTGRMFAAIVTPAGAPYYVRLAPEMAEALREGEVVRVSFDPVGWLKPADRIIARFAEENGGIYDPIRHQRELENRHRPRPDQPEPSPADRVIANVRRLERLARYRLATRLPDGRWQVPADLVSQLETRERTHPQHRLRVEPAAERERVRVGQAMAKQLGMSFVNDPPVFRGQVYICPPTSSGRPYVALVDHRRNELTLIPKSAELARLAGRVVAISRDRDGRLTIRLGQEISR
jgi:type IV secretory pathway VirD2 relaxase